jgi:spectinomycin phosphotransferase
MLEPPAIPESIIISRLWDEYTLRADCLCFLPLGADLNTAVYLVKAGNTEYFLKLRKGVFDEISVTLPHFLSEQGLAAIIAPLATPAGRLWGRIDKYRMILYPYIAGQDGYKRLLSSKTWQNFGTAMRAIHSANLPTSLRSHIPHESYSPHWRERVRAFQRQVETSEFDDPIAAKLAGFMREHRAEISSLVNRSEQLAGDLQFRAPPEVLCHGDIHPGNLLLPTVDPATLYIVDWDNPLYAPRERDLAMIGGTYAWRRAEDIALFYRGYHTEVNLRDRVDPRDKIDLVALFYYRCERIVVDIAEFCQQLLATTNGCDDRAQSYHYFISAFLPEHEVELAMCKEHFP